MRFEKEDLDAIREMQRMTEAALLRQVLDLAAMYGWKAFHVMNSTREVRPRGAAAGSRSIRVKNINPQGNGFPDVVLIHKERAEMIYAELKQEGKYLEPAQVEWRDAVAAVAAAIGNVPGVEPMSRYEPLRYFLWRPRDLDRIALILSGQV